MLSSYPPRCGAPIDTTRNTAPTALLTTESIQYPASALKTGANYFHADTVSPPASIGTSSIVRSELGLHRLQRSDVAVRGANACNHLGSRNRYRVADSERRVFD